MKKIEEKSHIMKSKLIFIFLFIVPTILYISLKDFKEKIEIYKFLVSEKTIEYNVIIYFLPDFIIMCLALFGCIIAYILFTKLITFILIKANKIIKLSAIILFNVIIITSLSYYNIKKVSVLENKTISNIDFTIYEYNDINYLISIKDKSSIFRNRYFKFKTFVSPMMFTYNNEYLIFECEDDNQIGNGKLNIFSFQTFELIKSINLNPIGFLQIIDNKLYITREFGTDQILNLSDFKINELKGLDLRGRYFLIEESNKIFMETYFYEQIHYYELLDDTAKRITDSDYIEYIKESRIEPNNKGSY